MDYHSLPRKQLQALCKKHDIPANLTNAQMADALTTILNAEAKPESDAKAWKKQCATVESGREEPALTVISNVPKASTRSKKEAVKSGEEGGSEELVTSAEHFEGNGGAKAGKTRRRDLSKLVPNAKEQEDKIDEGAGKLRRGTRSERSCKITESDLCVVDVVSKKMDKKTSASNDEMFDEKVKENVEETLQAQENDGRHLRHLKKKTMPEAQTKSKVVDIAEAKVTSPCKRTTRTRTGEVTRHPAVGTESSVKVSDGDEENGSNKFEPRCENRDTNAQKTSKSPVIIDLVDSDDEEDAKDQEKEDGSEPNTAVAPSENAVTAKPRMGFNKRMPAQRTLRGRKTNFSVEGSANLSESPKHLITRRGQKGVHREESLVNAGIEGNKNDAEASVNPSRFSKQVATCKGRKGGHKEVVDSSALGDTAVTVGVYVEPTVTVHKEEVVNAGREKEKADDAVGVSVKPTSNPSEFPEQVLIRRGRKGGQKDLLVTNNVEGAKNTVADISVGATVKASELLKQVVSRRGRKGDHKVEEVVNASTSSEEDKAGTVCVSVEPTVNPSVSLKQDVTEREGRGGQKEELLVTKSDEEAKRTSTDSVNVSESIKQVVARRGRKGGHKEEKVVNASSEEDKVDVVDISDEPTVNPSESREQIVTRRGRRVGQKEELMVSNRVEEAKNIATDVPVEATVNASESSRQVVTRKGHKGEHKEQGLLKASSEEDKVNAVCVSVEPTVNTSECQKQVVTRRGQKGGQEFLVTNSLEEDKNNATDISVEDNVNSSESPKRVVTRRGRKGGHKEEGFLKASAEEGKVIPVGISVKCTANPSESLKQVVTRRGRKDKQEEELLVAKIVKQAKNNVTNFPVEATVNYEDNASVEVTANPSSKQVVTCKGQKGQCKEELVNTSAEEDKVGTIDVSVECIEDQEKPCSEADESDVNEKKADCRNLKGKKYGSKIKTRRIQQRQQPAKNLQQDKDIIKEENISSSDTDVEREKAITRRGLRRNTTWTKPDIRKSRHQEDKVDAVEKDEAKAGEIVKESVDRNRQSSSKTEVAEMKENMDNHGNLKRKANTTRSHPRRSHTKQGPIENEVKKSSHQNTFPGNHQKDGKFNALEEIVEEYVQSGCEADMTDVKEKLSSCRNSERSTKSETKQTCGTQGSTDVKCPLQEKQKRESCQKTVSSHGNDKKKDIRVVRFSIYDEDRVKESINKRETQEILCTGEIDIETSFEKEAQPCVDAAEQLSKSSNLILELDSESEKDMVDAPGCKDSKGRGKSVQKPSGESHNGEENMQLQTSNHGSEDLIATVNDKTIHEEEVTAANIMVEAVEALMGEGSEKKAVIPMREESKSEPEDKNMEEILTSEGFKESTKKETLNALSSIVPTGDASFVLPDKLQVASAECIASKYVPIAGGRNLGDAIHMDQGGYFQDIEEAHADRDDKFASAVESVIESEQGKIPDEEQQINKVVLLTSEDTNESDLGVPVNLDKGSGTEFRESTCMPMPVEDGVLEKQHSQFVTEMPSPINQVEGGFHISSLIDQSQNMHAQEVTCVECFGNKMNCCSGIEEESSDKARLQEQVPEMLEVIHAKSRLGSAEVDNLEVLSDNVPDTLDENMEGQDSEFMVHFECSPDKGKSEEHQVPVMLEVLRAKSGVGYAEVDNLEALLDDVTDILDENIEVQDSEFLVYIKEEERIVVDNGFNEDTQEERGPSPTNNVVCQLVKDESGDEITKGGHFEMKSDEIHFSPHFTANAKEFSEKIEIAGEAPGKTDFDFDGSDESLEFEEEELNQPHGDSAGYQEDEGDFGKKSVDVYISSGLTAKAEVSEEQIVAGKSMRSTLFMDNYLDRPIESLEEESNQSSDSAGDPEDLGFLNVADLKENKLDFMKVSATEDRISVLDSFLHTSSVLNNNGDGSVEKKNPVSKLDVEIDNFPLLDETCKEHWDFHISEEIDHEENIEVSFVGLQNDKFLQGDEADKVMSSDYAESSKELDIEEEFPVSDACLQDDYLIFKDEADEDESRESEFSEECAVQENIFVSNRLLLNDSMVNDEAHEHELRGSSSTEEGNFNEGKEKELDKISEASYSEAEECHTGEISVANDGLQDHVSLVIDEAQEYQFNNSKMREEFDDSVVGYRIEFKNISESEAEVDEDFISQKNISSEGFHKFSNTICLNVENHQLEHIPYNEVQIACGTIPLSETDLQYEVHGGVSCKSVGRQELYSFNSLNGATPKKQEGQIPDVETLSTEEDQMEETLVEYETSQVESNAQVWKDSFDNLNMFSDAVPHEKEAQSEQISDSEVGHTENVFQNGLQVSNVSPIVDNKFHEEEMRDIGSIDEQVALSYAIPGKEDNHAEQPVENEAEETKTYEKNIQTIQMEYVYSLQSGGESRKEKFYGQCYHGESVVEMDKEIVHGSANSTGVLSEPCLVNDSVENENNSGVNGIQLINPIEFCGASEQEFEEAGKIDGCNVEAYAADIVITSGLYDDSPESQEGEKESSLSATPLKKLELMSGSNISPCSGMNVSAMKESEETLLTKGDEISPVLNNLFVEDCGTSLKKPELTSGTNVICCLGMNVSAMKESEETLLTNPCKKHLYESDTPMKMSELIKGPEELCTPSKKSEFTSSTNVSPCSGMDDSAAEERQEVLILEPCKLELPEFDTPSKMSESRKGHEKSPCLYTLFGEDTPLKKADLTSCTNATLCSGINDSSAEQSQEFLITEHSKLGLPELSTLSNMFEVTKSYKKSPCLDTLSGVNTPLKKTELTSSTNITPCSGINDSSAEQSQEFLITEHYKLGLPELSTLSNMFEVVKSHDKSPCLDTLSGENTPLKKTELTSSTNITPCSGMDDSAAKRGQEVLMTEHCKLELPEVDCPSKTLELTNSHDKALCLDALSGEDTPLKKIERTSTNTTPLSGADDSSIEQNTPSKIFDCTKDNSISPCLNTLCVEDLGTTLKKSGLTSNHDMSTCSGMDEFSVEHNREVLPIEACQLDLSEINTPSKVPELTKDSERSPCLNTLFTEVIGMPPFSGMGDSGIEQSRKILQKEACKLDCPDLNDHDRSPCLNTLFMEDIGTSSKNSDLMSTSDVSACSVVVDSVTQDVQEVLPTEDSQHELSQMDDSAVEPLELNPPSKMPELGKDNDRSSCLNTFVVDNVVTTSKNFEHRSSTGMSTCSGIDDSAVEQSGDVLTTEACKLQISELNTPPKEPELTRGTERSVDSTVPSLKNSELTSSTGMSSCSGIDDFAVEHRGDVLPTEACKLDLFELNTPSEISDLTKDHDKYPCLNTLFVEDIAISLKKQKLMRSTDMPLSSGMDDTAVEQSGYVRPTEACKPELSGLDTISKMAEFTKDNDISPCLNTLFLEDIGTSLKKPAITSSNHVQCCSGLNDSAIEQSGYVLPTEACKPELSELDTALKMAEFTKDNDISPWLNTLFLEDIGTSLKKPAITSSTHVQCCSGLNDSVIEQSKAVLPMEVCKQEHYEFDTPLMASKLTNGHSLSPCLNMLLAEDLGTASEMPQPTNSTGISACSGVADSVLHKKQEIHQAANFKHEHSQMDTPLTIPKWILNGNISCSNFLIVQSSSTPSENVGMDDSAPEQSLVILPTENSKQQCYQFDTRLKMGEPMEGHNNPSSHSKLAVESDMIKFSLRQLQRLYKEKLIKQKGSEKMAGKHPALQDFSSSSFRKCELSYSPFSGIGDSFLEQSQQVCPTDMCCNNEPFQVNITEGYDKLDRPDKYSTGCNDALHQASVAGIKSPELTNSYNVSSCSGIDDPIPEQSQQACVDLCCNNEPLQVNAPLNESEVTERYCKLDMPDEYNTGSNDVLHPASMTGIRLQELTNSYEVSSCSGIDNPIPEQSQQAYVDLCCNNEGPSQVNTPLNESKVTEGYGKLDRPEEYNTGSNDDVLHPALMAGIKLQELTNSYEVSPCSGIHESLLEQSQEACWRDLGNSELAEVYDKPENPEQYSTPLEKLECTGGYNVLCESSVAGIKSQETSFLDEREVWVCKEEPPMLNNSVETRPFVECDTVCMKTPATRIGESRKTSLANRLDHLTNRLLTIQRNLQGQTPELSYATPLRKAMNRKSTGSAKKSRFPMSGSAKKSRLAIESDKVASTKENPIEQTQLSVKKDQRLQIKSKDSEKVVGKRPALQKLSSNVLEQKVDSVGQSLPPEKRMLHIHEEDCS